MKMATSGYEVYVLQSCSHLSLLRRCKTVSSSYCVREHLIGNTHYSRTSDAHKHRKVLCDKQQHSTHTHTHRTAIRQRCNWMAGQLTGWEITTIIVIISEICFAHIIGRDKMEWTLFDACARECAKKSSATGFVEFLWSFGFALNGHDINTRTAINVSAQRG